MKIDTATCISTATPDLSCCARANSALADKPRNCGPRKPHVLLSASSTHKGDFANMATTPNAADHDQLDALASRYVDVESLPWEPTRFDGIEVKTLLKDESGLLTTLVRFQPGAVLPDHEHVEFEQSWVLEGSLVDDEGEAIAGNFVWRPGGSRHSAHAPSGALVLSFFLKPNIFFDQDDAPAGFE